MIRLSRILKHPSRLSSAECKVCAEHRGAKYLRTMNFRVLQGALLLALPLFFVQTVSAQGAEPTPADLKAAGAAFDRGRVAYDEEQYVQAAENFESADTFAPSPAALRLALAMRYQAGQLDRAATLAALALRRYPNDEKLGPEARAIIEEAQESLLRIVVVCDEECDLAVDGKLQHAGRAEEHMVFSLPGTHQVSAGWSSGRAFSQDVTGSAAEEKSLQFQAPVIEKEPEILPQAPAAATTSQEAINYEPWAEEPATVETTGWKPVVFWTSLGITVAGAGASTALTIYALNNPGKDEVLDNCEQGDRDCPLFQEGIKNQRNSTIAWSVTGAAAAFTLVTGVWFTDWSKPAVSSLLGNRPAKSPGVPGLLTYRRGDFSVTPNFTAGQLELGQGARVFATGTF